MPIVPVYTGRFAPSPSGPLHFGSLIAAISSYLQAKSQQGNWLLRIEDIDSPRTVPGAADSIMRTLELFGLYWHGPVIYQSQRLERYQDIFNQLKQQNLIYGCQCSRKQIAEQGGTYQGQCASLGLTTGRLAWRLRANAKENFTDLVFGEQTISAEIAAEDYIIKRRDGLFSYQLAVVVDDWDQGVTEVIRGADLLEMTPRQQALFQLLQAAAPQYGHIPLAVSAPNMKLSKQNHATDIRNWPVAHTLAKVLQFLGHPIPLELKAAPATELLSWAIKNWQIAKVSRQYEILHTEFL
ncbi:tRNA glutamyl-Q(34) synthetase GluQRS [Rheinheimera sp. MMS21-TC3]|uniref:tRNA glutamyl-Q(34) synthetase GluQRS n=1 Tax=Rheinheimera sp. MMS21-TC3 TaxID=3072790 RepID=UPI0028C454E1|nr:tRNA glutamyl-Q(34) synthetase GluQRS [Rheinheimera sp. MMS21-TC3]WNO60524.1 tRNA glutamyl-Q(34) synthetase GluQRS [Rheinheimera sp. MMS21-TC3]